MGTKLSDRSPSRRQFLRAGATLGIGATATWGLSGVIQPTAGPIEIVYAYARTEPDSRTIVPRTKRVSARWYEQVTRAFNVQEQLRAANISGLVGSFAAIGSHDDPNPTLSITATDRGVLDTIGEFTADLSVDLTVPDTLPDTIQNGSTSAETYQVSSLDRTRVPAGVACTVNGQTGTLSPALYSTASGRPFFSTSNHVYGAKGTKATAHKGQSLSLLHDGETVPIGRVDRGYPAADVVTLDPMGPYQPASQIAGVTPGTVIGQYTKVGVADLMARSEPLTKFGAASRKTQGQIKGVDGVTCYTGKICKFGQLRWGTEQTLDNGDSGSVNFHRDPENPDDYVLIGGINNARTWWPGMNFTWGTAGHHLREEYGLQF